VLGVVACFFCGLRDGRIFGPCAKKRGDPRRTRRPWIALYAGPMLAGKEPVHRTVGARLKSVSREFWATWCEKCREEIARPESFREQTRIPKIGVPRDCRLSELQSIRRQLVDRFAQGISDLFELPTLIGSATGAGRAFHQDARVIVFAGLPFTITADRQGRLTHTQWVH